jgi:hypothetical protein
MLSSNTNIGRTPNQSLTTDMANLLDAQLMFFYAKTAGEILTTQFSLNYVKNKQLLTSRLIDCIQPQTEGGPNVSSLNRTNCNKHLFLKLENHILKLALALLNALSFQLR